MNGVDPGLGDGTKQGAQPALVSSDLIVLQASSTQKASSVCNLYLTLFLVIDIVLSNVQ